jgi:indolepyruvate ferredoxin oxidoreductase alpha subunit
MGASIGNALGMEKALGREALGKIAAVIGDSTFIHSGITGLIDVVYNRGFTTVIILDNRITAMTGRQPNPVTGETITRDRTNMIDLEALCRAIGVKHVYTVNPHEIDRTQDLLKREIERPEPSVIITKYPCVLLPEERKRKKNIYMVLTEKCTGCKSCLRLGCPAIEWIHVNEEEPKRSGFFRKGQTGYVRISNALCTGCAQCVHLCNFESIVLEDKK